MSRTTGLGRFLLLAAIAYALIVAGLLTLTGGLLAMALPLVTYLAMTLIQKAPRIDLAIERSVSADSVPQNKPVTVTLKITNQGDSLDEVEIDDSLPAAMTLVEGKTRVLTSLPRGAGIELRYTVKAPRGSYLLQDVHVSANDHLGVLHSNRTIPARARIVFMPEIIRLKKVAIRPQRTHGHFGPIPSRQAGSGIDFYGLREYQMGDPRRWINWRASERYDQRLFVNQFEQERIADVGIILDARQQSNIISPAGESLFEYGVQAAGSLSEALLNDGNRVGLLVYGFGVERVFPGYGKVQQERIMSALGQARTGHNFALESLGYLPTRFFPPGSQVVMVSPLMAGDLPAFSQLRACGYEVLIVSPDPVDFEARSLKLAQGLGLDLAQVERVLLLRKLQRMGVRVLDWQVARPFEPLVRATLTRVTPGRRQGIRGS